MGTAQLARLQASTRTAPAAQRARSTHAPGSAPGEVVPAKPVAGRSGSCACGGSCPRCSAAKGPVPGQPAKALGLVPEIDDPDRPRPAQGSATIECDGSGGYQVVYNGWGGAACGTLGCVTAHENSHIADWRSKWPNGCTGQAKGYLPAGRAGDNPRMSSGEYNDFLKESECRAHTIDLACAEALPKTAGCEATVNDYTKLTSDQKDNACSGMSRATKTGIGVLGGALAGAGIGGAVGGWLGALIGGGIGALIGGIGSLFF
jgi:hypothetical protein